MKMRDLIMPILAMEMMAVPSIRKGSKSYLKSQLPTKEYKRRKKRLQIAKKSRSINHK